jgi:hypothetical protein
MHKIDHKIAYLLVLVVFLGASTAFGAKYYLTIRNNLLKSKQATEEIIPIVTESVAVPATEEIKEQIVKEPPKHTTKQTISTTQSGAEKVTTVSNGGLSQTESNNYLANCKSSSSPSSASVTDSTGRYPALASVLTTYLNGLRWGNEINSFCGIFVQDAGATGWSGQYVASYRADGSGRIVSAQGAILLNASYYSQLNQSTFNEYMKLILSHEYGHHYTQYHKWVDLNLPINVRFPDSYYTIRPLSKSTTVVDCSNSWSACESEIIAEDYSYLYSGFGMHQMSSTIGFPSVGTKTWLDNLIGASSPTTPPPVTPPVTPPTTEPPTTPPADVTPPITTPSISILSPISPYTWSSDTVSLHIQIRTSSADPVVKIKLYVNNIFANEISAANVDVSWAYSSVPAGEYTFKAEAYDANNNTATADLVIIKR